MTALRHVLGGRVCAAARVLAGPLAGARRATKVVAGVVAAALVVAVGVAVWPSHGTDRATALFTGAVGVVKGTDVRILGITVGQVTSVRPEGDQVAVGIVWDSKYRVPAGAQAVVVAPSVVSDRYVQLTPVYTGGPALASGATIPLARTATPVELDRVLGSLDDLSVALGPHGANADGALTRLLRTGAANLSGNGTALHQTVDGLSQAVTTLADGRDNLFGTVSNLQQLTATLAKDDGTVRTFETELASVADQLAGERGDLAAAVRNLGTALTQVASFVHDNAGALTTDIAGLAQVTGVLAKDKAALAKALDAAPAALSNLQLAYDPRGGTLDVRDNLAQLSDPALFLCTLLTSLGQPASTCSTVSKVFSKLPPLPTLPTTGPLSKASSAVPDLTLGGILGGTPR